MSSLTIIRMPKIMSSRIRTLAYESVKEVEAHAAFKQPTRLPKSPHLPGNDEVIGNNASERYAKLNAEDASPMCLI